MSPGEFQIEMSRLSEQFGKQTYSTERCKLLWQEIQNLSHAWFARVVDRFIGEFRQAPLMPEFREEIAKERERLWKKEKEQHSKDAEAFFESSFDTTEMKTICQFILKRLAGGVTDVEYATFLKHLRAAAKSASKTKVKCDTCDDAGHVVFWDGKGNSVIRCYCPQGSKQPATLPRMQAKGAYAS